MSLQIMSKLQSLGHELYERVFHRGEVSRSGVPVSIDDTATTLRMSRDASLTDTIDDVSDGPSDDAPDDASYETIDEAIAAASGIAREPVRDSGDLYGVHIVAASDRAQLDDDHAFESGQNWIESLETHAAEGGPEPEQEIEIEEDDELTSPPSDTKDTPVADRGSGGPRGV